MVDLKILAVGSIKESLTVLLDYKNHKRLFELFKIGNDLFTNKNVPISGNV